MYLRISLHKVLHKDLLTLQIYDFTHKHPLLLMQLPIDTFSTTICRSSSATHVADPILTLKNRPI